MAKCLSEKCNCRRFRSSLSPQYCQCFHALDDHANVNLVDHPAFHDNVPAGKSDTSRAAFESIKPTRETKRQRVYNYIGAQGDVGATNQEIETALGMLQSTVQPRCNELWRGNSIRDSGRRRLTASGRKAKVWITT